MQDAIFAVRAFNRFYTRLIGALDARFLGLDISLPEARLLFEIAQGEAPVAQDLQAALDLDAGYLSRLLKGFEARGWIQRERSAQDGRRRPIRLTPAGREIFAALDQRQRDAVVELLKDLPPGRRNDLAAALGAARLLLGDRPAEPHVIRPIRPGEMSLVASRQTILYDEMHGWGPGLEPVELETAAQFLRNFRPGRDQGWVAELAGAVVGSIFITDEGDGVCRLRLLYVEPTARGRGIGEDLVRTCIAFAEATGYARMWLWTHTVLESARRIYAAHGFELTEVETHEEFGMPVQGETWWLDLTVRK